MNWLHILADLSSIITASVAVFAFVPWYVTLHRRRTKLEELLSRKSEPNDDSLTVSQCAATLKMTEDQVVETAFKSQKIEGWGGQSGVEYRLKFLRKPM
jgi:hypothetical protein